MCLLLLWRRARYGYAFRRIILTQGKFTIVDQDDFNELNKHKWHLSAGNSQNYYAARTVRKNNTQFRCIMHRQIIKAPDGLFVDHINRNGLDNRKANLRIVTAQQNSWNSRMGTSRAKSKYKGVVWDGKKQKWRARIYINNKSQNLGYFEDEKTAAKAYDRAAEKYRGEYAFLNFAEDKGHKVQKLLLAPCTAGGSCG